MYGISTTAGASEKTPGSAAAGTTSNRDERDDVWDQHDGRRQREDPGVSRRRNDVLLLDELDAVGDQLGPAVERAGLHRPQASLHVREHLVLHVPDGERHHEEHQHHRNRLHDERDPVPADRGIEDGGVADPSSSSTSSPSGTPGHGLTSRDIKGKSFRSGNPSNGSGRRSLTGCGWPSNRMPNISIVSRSCQSQVGNRSLTVGHAGSVDDSRTLTRTLWWCSVEVSCVTTSNPSSPPRSTPAVKSQKSHASAGSSRRNRTRSW